jgi:transketolase
MTIQTIQTIARTEVPDSTRLGALAARARWLVLSTVSAKKAGHVGGPLSAMDLLVSLYFGALRIDPSAPCHPDRDRFILSKGHNAIAQYAVMALRGYFDVAELKTFGQGDSRLQGHPDSLLLPGLDASTGSLGQGLSVGIGMALAARRANKDFMTWVMLGDGEHQEGMVWESVLCARRYGLDNLVAIIDRNGLQQYGWPLDGEPGSRFDRLDPWAGVDLAGVYRAFGWNVLEIDGHDLDEIAEAFEAPRASLRGSGRPTVIMARTIKGKGISFTEGRYAWHNGVANDVQLAQARQDLGLRSEEEI